MKLKKIQIANYRSIKDVTFNLNGLDDDSSTYGLIGVNEAGKSSFLKAIALKNLAILPSSKDFQEKSKNIEVSFEYALDSKDDYSIFESISDGAEGALVLGADSPQLGDLVSYRISFSSSNPTKPIYEFIYPSKLVKNTPNSILVTEAFFNKNTHKTIFWEAKEEYLITNQISLAAFAASPEKVSIPLKNCFNLADIGDIDNAIKNISGDSTEKKDLEERLGKAVTEHILKVWPNHPIKIEFDIDNLQINLHVKDIKTKGKAKTADQRSDGFKQFISFLLTISAEDRVSEFSNCILLLDEPETHLHPRAQIDFLNELKKITTNKRENIAIFATHSNYMIDKDKLSRNFKVSKEKDSTEITSINSTDSTYASVNYEVFEIPTAEYHSELYGILHERYKNANENEEKRQYILDFDNKFLTEENKLPKIKPYKANNDQVTLPTYIRNCINHPESGNIYTQQELIEAIELLRKIKYA